MINSLGRSALLLVAVMLTGGCRWGAEQWGPFRGQVVDAETGVPISGANVMVSWERDNPNPVHWTQSFYDAQETVTDTDGRFEIPRETRFVTAFVSQPRFAVFAASYVAKAEHVTPIGGRLFIDATTVMMRPLKTQEERCTYEPHGIGARFSKSEAPRFSSAIDQYVAFLRCAEIREP